MRRIAVLAEPSGVDGRGPGYDGGPSGTTNAVTPLLEARALVEHLGGRRVVDGVDRVAVWRLVAVVTLTRGGDRW